jgi:hypothetical protein
MALASSHRDRPNDHEQPITLALTSAIASSEAVSAPIAPFVAQRLARSRVDLSARRGELVTEASVSVIRTLIRFAPDGFPIVEGGTKIVTACFRRIFFLRLIIRSADNEAAPPLFMRVSI